MGKKYIDAGRLKAEINKRKKSLRAGICGEAFTRKQKNEMLVALEELDRFNRIIDSLQQEQPEVDLEKEYQEFCKDYPFPWSSQYVNKEYIDELCLSVARHFYELGRLNARVSLCTELLDFIEHYKYERPST